MKNYPHLISSFIILIIFIHSSGYSQDKAWGKDLQTLIESERNFSNTSILTSTRNAFLTFLSDNAIVFHPQPVPGKKTYQASPESKSLLTWEPEYAEISSAGDIGYTTGPWEFRINKTDSLPLVCGHYISIWKKQADNSWKVEMDIGIPHKPPEIKTKEVATFTNTQNCKMKEFSKKDIDKELKDLMEIDNKFGKISGSEGYYNTLMLYAVDNVRFYRTGLFPVMNKDTIRSYLSQKKGTYIYKQIKCDIASSLDFGYTTGISKFIKTNYKNEPADSSSYMKIWRKDQKGEWKITLDISIPINSSKSK